MSRHLCIILCVLGFVVQLTAKEWNNSLSGQIIDSTTNKPVVYVNIFLANTTLGTTSDSSGYYAIKNIPPGNYSLVVSHISYTADVRSVQILPGQHKEYNFALIPTVLQMPSVQIQGMRDKEWRQHFEAFEKEFLGYSKNADACEFLNPQVLNIVKQSPTTYSAETIRPLHLRHNNFGYHITLFVRSFTSSDNQVSYSVLPAFKELEPRDETEQQAWQQNRREAFYGSYRHFFASLFQRQLKAAGFSLEQVGEAKRFRASTASHTPETAKGVIYSDTGIGFIKSMHFDDFLRVRYQENWAQTSFLKLPTDTVQVDWAGNALYDADILRSGYWGSIRFADELPLNYMPE